MKQSENTHRVDWTERPIFRDPERYDPDRFNRISEHYSGRLRHALIGIAGSGVVYGFAIETDAKGCCRVKKGAIYIGCGLAIDVCGRMLYWPGGWVSMGDIAGNNPEKPGKYTLLAHYAERPRNTENHCGCDRADAAWIEEGVVFSLRKDCCPCKEDCPEHCEHCISTNAYICGRTGSDENGIPMDEDLEFICKEPEELCHVACADWLYDAEAGLPLACVELCEVKDGDKDCKDALEFCCTEPIVCSQRDYVYRNPLLYELIKGCQYDLARVDRLNFESWLSRDWDDAVPFAEFVKRLHSGLTVYFTKPIQKSTLTPASVYLTAVVREQDSFFQDVLRLPMNAFTYHGESNGNVDGITIRFPKRWVTNQLESEISRFNFGSIIELTIRCAMLRDECDCMPDARPLGLEDDCDRKCPTDKPAQQMPGGDFVVAFCVDRKRVDSTKGDDRKQDDEKQTEAN